MQDEISALQAQVDALRTELEKAQSHASEQREAVTKLLAEREVNESAKKAELEHRRRESERFDSAARLERIRAPRNRSGSSSRRRHWNRTMDRFLRWIAIGAFVLAVCGIVGTLIFSFSESDSQLERDTTPR
jgi:chromosome segregation ATPase